MGCRRRARRIAQRLQAPSLPYLQRVDTAAPRLRRATGAATPGNEAEFRQVGWSVGCVCVCVGLWVCARAPEHTSCRQVGAARHDDAGKGHPCGGAHCLALLALTVTCTLKPPSPHSFGLFKMGLVFMLR